MVVLVAPWLVSGCEPSSGDIGPTSVSPAPTCAQSFSCCPGGFTHGLLEVRDDETCRYAFGRGWQYESAQKDPDTDVSLETFTKCLELQNRVFSETACDASPGDHKDWQAYDAACRDFEVGRVGEGETCRPDQCALGLWCTASFSGTGVCKPQKPDGDECRSSAECVSSNCEWETCRPSGRSQPKLNERCL